MNGREECRRGGVTETKGRRSRTGQPSWEAGIIPLDGTGDLVVKRGGGGRGDREWVQKD